MRRKADDGVTNCLAYVFLIIFLMPVVGLVMLLSEDKSKHTVGAVLLIIGIVMWLAAFS